MLDMANDSDLFETAPGEGLLPLYEAKMIWQFEHRLGTYEGRIERGFTNLDLASDAQLREPQWRPVPFYWVPEVEVLGRLASLGETKEHGAAEEGDDQIDHLRRLTPKWLIGFRDVTNTTNERTTIFSLLPRVGVGHTAPLVFLNGTSSSVLKACFLSNVNALPLDYVARQKIGGMHLTYSLLNQFPILAPDKYDDLDFRFIIPRIFELVCTAWDIKPFADDLWREAGNELKSLMRQQLEANIAATGGHEFKPPAWAETAEDGFPLPPFKWDEDRRAQIRAELDAYYALLYGLTRDELRYIIDPKDVYGPDFPSETFRVLKEKEEKRFGEYRTRRLVLEAFDKLAESPRFRDEITNRSPVVEIPGTHN
jgi:hypothetical protein